MLDFKKKFSLEDRLSESKRIKKKYPERVPVIVEKRYGSSLRELDKYKYLVPDDLTVGQFIYVIRKRIKLCPSEALFVFVNGILPSPDNLMIQLYNECMDLDGYLYFVISEESTYG